MNTRAKRDDRLELAGWRAALGMVLGALVCSATLPMRAAAQDGPGATLFGIVDDPCPSTPPIEAGPPQEMSEAEQEALRQEFARRMQADWGGLCRYRAANDALAGEPAPRVVFMGDSITEFWSTSDPLLFGDGVINRGISGQTSPQMLVRFHADVIALRPAAVHIMAGTNDLAGNTGPSRPEDFKNNIRAMAEMARANDIAVVLASIPPAAVFPWRPEVAPAPIIAELNAWLESHAAENGLVFVDYHSAMTGPSGELRPELSGDGVHPNADGYALMRPLMVQALAAAGVALKE